MTEHPNDRADQSDNPSRPEGRDTSEAMDNKTTHDPDTTEVLPSAETPPTQEIAQATQHLPQGSAPEGEVHPAYGVAAARVQEQEAASATVQDAPAPDDSDPLAPLRDPAPEVTAPASGPGPDAAPTQAQPAQPTQAQQVQSAQPAQAAQPAAPAAVRRGPRVGTAVWGLIVIAVGLGILAVSVGVMFDLGVALIALLGAAGVILVVGSVISSLRRR
ncbi:hypothetical protein APR04_001495 [Promicromonospora umidemergens]|uniref:Uncharacterized protein n=1 Tax=Promicromonospora umidemergens TaxID=629679 RepID=A0ABP8Y6B8_9MICO|nr:hypothetical protein [Promicromonospora umidemergens]MCP2282597.1 hypothetical protein [Promicromonospora umidemergens]